MCLCGACGSWLVGAGLFNACNLFFCVGSVLLLGLDWIECWRENGWNMWVLAVEIYKKGVKKLYLVAICVIIKCIASYFVLIVRLFWVVSGLC